MRLWTQPAFDSIPAASPAAGASEKLRRAPTNRSGSRVTPALFRALRRRAKIMASTAAAQQRKAVLLEARMRGLTGSEASSAFAPAQTTSLDPPVTEVGLRITHNVARGHIHKARVRE